MEALVDRIGPNYNIWVAASGSRVQLNSICSGVLCVSTRGLRGGVDAAHKDMKKHYKA